MTNQSPNSKRFARTHAVTAGRPAKGPGVPVNGGIALSSTFHAGGDLHYGRDGNATWSALEEAIAVLEGGQHAFAFASGMAATNAILDDLPLGAIVVAGEHQYAGTRVRLEELNASRRIALRTVDVTRSEQFAAAMTGAAAVFVESPTNPLLEICDLRALATAARAAGALSVVDNTFATPISQRPLNVGIDVVMHSATKFLSGHADVLLGALVTSSPDVAERLHHRRSVGGAIAGPFEAFLTLRGIRTLAIRVERATENAGEIARRLTAHPAVETVRYPGLPEDPGHTVAARQMDQFGALLAIDVGDAVRAESVAERTQLWTHATSLGGVESLIERRSRWPFEHADVPEGLLRLSVGIEDVEDLWSDLDEALAI